MRRPGLFWLTFNPSDIATAKQFMDSLKGDNTVDVLGLTRTMEGVSDILFPRYLYSSQENQVPDLCPGDHPIHVQKQAPHKAGVRARTA